MRVLIYVPDGPGASRTRRSVERDVVRQGHEIVGYARAAAEVRAVLNAGATDLVAGRPEHLAALESWALPVPRPRSVPPAVAAIGAAVAAALWTGRRRWVTVAAAMAAALTALVLLPDTQPHRSEPYVAPSAIAPTPVPTPAPTPTPAATPPTGPETRAPQPSRETEQGTQTPAPTSSAASTSHTTVPQPTEQPTPKPRKSCLVEIDIVILDLCL